LSMYMEGFTWTPTHEMTEEEIADIIIKADERFDILTRRHRIAFANVIAKHVSRDWFAGSTSMHMGRC
jgi:hypothetical protein